MAHGLWQIWVARKANHSDVCSTATAMRSLGRIETVSLPRGGCQFQDRGEGRIMAGPGARQIPGIECLERWVQHVPPCVREGEGQYGCCVMPFVRLVGRSHEHPAPVTYPYH
jgi:hypothetical protein